MSRASSRASVVMVGRINVGKSSLFNRLTSTAKAIVSSVPGTTRDRNYGTVLWNGKTFSLIDTGGVDVETVTSGIEALGAGKRRAKKLLSPGSIEHGIVRQTRTALQQAKLVLLMVDAKTGLLPDDKTLALALKKLGKPVVLVCNKVDSPKVAMRVAEFYKLGLGTPWQVSAANGSGTGDLLDHVYTLLGGKLPPADTVEMPAVRVALLGRPNVGKSSLVNKILGEERVIVSPVAQTTREPQDTGLLVAGQPVMLVDTAGLRRTARIEPGIENVATQRTLAALRRSDVALFVTEADVQPSAQDRHLAGVLIESGVGIIIIANKWDQLEGKTEKSATHTTKVYRGYYPGLSWAPVLFTSALTGRGVEKVLPLALAVARQRAQEVPAQGLQEILKLVLQRKRPVQAKGEERPHIYSLTQTHTNPPKFAVELGKRQSLHFSYMRFIENQIRDKFDFVGVPVRVEVVTRRK